jgi:phospholipid/cholesterol/gamma-HCH transport system substrate-binding protein
VLDQKIAANNYEAVITVSIRPDLHLPDDTVASIASEGLLGDKFLKLEPGHSKALIAEDGMIANTKNAQSLEDQVGRIIFLATEGGKPAEKK